MKLLIYFIPLNWFQRGESLVSSRIASRWSFQVGNLYYQRIQSFRWLYVTLYIKTTRFDYFFQFSLTSYPFSLSSSLSASFLYSHLRHKREFSEKPPRGTGAGASLHPAFASPPRSGREAQNSSRERRLFFLTNSNPTARAFNTGSHDWRLRPRTKVFLILTTGC